MYWRAGIFFIAAAWLAGKTVLTWLSYATLAFAGAFSLCGLAAALSLLRPRRRDHACGLGRSPRGNSAGAGRTDFLTAGAGPEPAVTILKPLKGADCGLYENLASFCAQDYPEIQILCAAASPDDPALPVVARLRRDFPNRDISVVVSDGRIGCNPKINNIANAYPLAKHELLLLSDSDIRVPRDFLRRCVARFHDPEVGLVTCFYRSAQSRGLWGALEALFINAQFLPQTLLAAAAGLRFAMGAAIMVRRDIFDEAGGFGALADHLADDFALGEAVAKAGYLLEFSSVVVESVPHSGQGLRDIFRHQVRWQRTIRLCSPAGYCGSLLLHGFSLASLTLLLFGWNARLALAAGAFLLVKAAASLLIQSLSGARPVWAPLALLPLSDWLAFGAWLSGFAPGEVVWRGQRYRVLPRGRLVAMAAEPRESLALMAAKP